MSIKDIDKLVAVFQLLGLALIMLGLSWATVKGLEREAKRLDVVREYNQKHFGAHIERMQEQNLGPSY